MTLSAALGNRSFIDREREDARAEAEALRLLHRAHGRHVRTAPRRRYWWTDEQETK